MTEFTTSNVSPLPQRAEVEEQAAAWLVRLDQGSLSATEQAELSAWVEANALHRDTLMRLARLWDSMAVMEDLAQMFPLPRVEDEKRLGGTAPSSSFGWFEGPRLYAASAACLFVLAALFLGLLQTADQDAQWHRAGVGEQARIQLRDGSVMTLNTDSAVRVRYSDSQRLVELVQGEAHFSVAKDPKRPFNVKARGGVVQAVGTEFTVRLLDLAVDVTVSEGRVLVAASEKNIPPDVLAPASDREAIPQHALLSAGKSLQYNKDLGRVQKVDQERLEQKLAWQKGRLIFRGEPLGEALKEIARYTDKKLLIADPAIEEIRIGGRYQLQDIHSLLTAIAQNLDIDIDHSGNVIRLSSKQ